MKHVLGLIFLLAVAFAANAQIAEQYFNTAANQYIDGDKQLALNTLDEALTKYPSNSDLAELQRRLMEEEQQEEQDQQNQQQQENQDQQDSENQEGEENDQQEQEQQQDQSEQSEEQEEGEQEQQQEQEGEEGEQQDQQQQREQNIRDKLQEMNISEEKARMILEAMRNNEIQYIQQQRRKATQRPESGKPDW